ncbi:hypothetical protein LGN20_29595 [Burkholderia cepacia]|uniref:hypothetical protein n=1 Tax=Burkholderia cepacia TaxID=292 RepID=UPI001CF4CFD2|nr:hypothetical protein [Burkholderia cepacia]MCA8218074.1 hypothetical protein [Burkholderia cepacia]
MSFLSMRRGMQRIRAMSASWRAVCRRAERAKRAASSTRVRPKRFDAMSGNGAADGVQSSMHPAETLAQFHCLERRLYEAIPPSGKVTRHFITNYYRCRRVSFPTISLPDARA